MLIACIVSTAVTPLPAIVSKHTNPTSSPRSGPDFASARHHPPNSSFPERPAPFVASHPPAPISLRCSCRCGGLGPFSVPPWHQSGRLDRPAAWRFPICPQLDWTLLDSPRYPATMALGEVSNSAAARLSLDDTSSLRTALPTRIVSSKNEADMSQRLRARSPPSEDEGSRPSVGSPLSSRGSHHQPSPTPPTSLPQPLSPASVAAESSHPDASIDGMSDAGSSIVQGQSGQVCRQV